MAEVTCAKCGKGFTRTCSCQGNVCPACKSAARTARNGAFRKAGANGRATAAAVSTVKFRVTYRDGRPATEHDTAVEAAAVRKAARTEGVRTFLRTVRVPVPVEVESEAS